MKTLPSSKYIYNNKYNKHQVEPKKKKQLSDEGFKLAKSLGFSKLDFAVAIELKKALYWQDKA